MISSLTLATIFSRGISPMLVARRDPPFHSGVHDAAPGIGATPAPVHARFMTGLQLIGSVLAIPVGLASGYSIYHANFSTEAHCQGLRANIVSMLDKSADAYTLRMLVRRDVAAFEASCGNVDPDAVAAFKTLLIAGKVTAPEKVARAPGHLQKASPAKTVRASETPTIAETQSAHRDNPADVNWIATVRRALTRDPAVRREVDMHTEVVAPALPSDAAAPPHPLGQLVVPASTPGIASAPALPPPASVAALPPPTTAERHPVPPGSIPDSVPQPQPVNAVPVAAHSGSGLTRLIEKLPLLGHMVGR
jgi:hypothetical protein